MWNILAYIDLSKGQSDPFMDALSAWLSGIIKYSQRDSTLSDISIVEVYETLNWKVIFLVSFYHMIAIDKTSLFSSVEFIVCTLKNTSNKLADVQSSKEMSRRVPKGMK